MKEIRLSPAAQRDLDGIWDYSEEKWGPQKAQEYVEAIRDTLTAIASGKRITRPVSVREGYFKCAAGSHVVFFYIDKAFLDVVRILHQRMDAERHL